MSRVALVLLAVGACSAVFGWWGVYTVEGRRRFDEMAGMIPMAALHAGWVLAAAALVWLAVSAQRAG